MDWIITTNLWHSVRFFGIMRQFWEDLKIQEMKLASELLTKLCWRNFKRLFDLSFAVCTLSYRGSHLKDAGLVGRYSLSTGLIVAKFSEEHSAHIFRFRSKRGDLEDEGTTLLRNVGNFTSLCSVTSSKTLIFINTAVRTWTLTR
jgi:hypothetical protein